MTPIEGVDYADSHPSIAALVAAGKHFACRYGGPGRPQKQITAGEVAALHGAGIAIVANAEGAVDGLKGGRSAGIAWATSALAYFTALGLPDDRPIYLSVDWQPSSADWPALDAAMDGAASVLGRARVGVYGGYATIAHFAANGKARWLWQTYAWSGGRWHPGAHIQQYRNGVAIGGADCDLNRAMVDDYGQWPKPEDNDMFDFNDKAKLTALFDYKNTVKLDTDATPDGTGTLKDFPVPIVGHLLQLEEDVAELKARPPVSAAPVDVAALRAVLLDPEVVAAYAKAAADLVHADLAD